MAEPSHNVAVATRCAPAMAVTAPSTIADAAEAFAAIALAAVACDGELASSEARSLRQHLEFRHPYRELGDAAMAALLDKLLLLQRQQGWQGLVQLAAPHLQADTAETALAVAASLTQADHVESTAELTFLQTLSSALAIEPDRATVILEVMAILNRDSLAH